MGEYLLDDRPPAQEMSAVASIQKTALKRWGVERSPYLKADVGDLRLGYLSPLVPQQDIVRLGGARDRLFVHASVGSLAIE